MIPKRAAEPSICPNCNAQSPRDQAKNTAPPLKAETIPKIPASVLPLAEDGNLESEADAFATPWATTADCAVLSNDRDTRGGARMLLLRRPAVCVAIAALFLCVVGVFSWTVWPTQYTFTKITIRGSTYPVRINRLTGKAELLFPDGWRSEQDERARMDAERAQFAAQQQRQRQAQEAQDALAIARSINEPRLMQLPEEQLRLLDIKLGQNKQGTNFLDVYNGTNVPITEIVVQLELPRDTFNFEFETATREAERLKRLAAEHQSAIPAKGAVEQWLECKSMVRDYESKIELLNKSSPFNREYLFQSSASGARPRTRSLFFGDTEFIPYFLLNRVRFRIVKATCLARLTDVSSSREQR